MNNVFIGGIQQVGIGVANLKEAWAWYRQNFGVDVRIFEDVAKADLMKNYTGGEVRSRHAALALNLQGGGGFEIWQYTDRVPKAPAIEAQLGELGIFAVKIKSQDVPETFRVFQAKGLNIVGGLKKDMSGKDTFFVKDPYNNIFQIVCSSNVWFRNERKLTGATYGAIIGTSNMGKAIRFYSSVLGYDEIVYDKTGIFEDFKSLPGGDNSMRRVLLFHSKERIGIFKKMFGASYIELVSSVEKEKQTRKIFKDRYWGDLGFIHLCFDIRGMGNLKKLCKKEGFPFTVDSMSEHDPSGFDMGEANGHFAYVEDPDGTLIEFVEALRIPIIKKLGWYINLRKRDPRKALPNWLLKTLRFNRLKG